MWTVEVRGEEVRDHLRTHAPVGTDHLAYRGLNLGIPDVSSFGVAPKENELLHQLRAPKSEANGGRPATREREDRASSQTEVVDERFEGGHLISELHPIAFAVAQPGAGPIIAIDSEVLTELCKEALK